MPLINPWVGYLDRSYTQIKQAILAKLPTQLPELTDHSENSEVVKLISIWAGLLEMLGFYVDNQARESYSSTARRFSSVAKLAKMFDYRIKGTLAASADVTFALNAPAGSPVTVPAGTAVSTKEGIPFYTLATAIIPAGAVTVTVSARQAQRRQGVTLGQTTGLAGQAIPVETGVVDNTVYITVNGQPYQPVETLAYAAGGDLVFTGGLDETGVYTVALGDGVNGALPGAAQPVVAEYYVSRGAAGNVAENTITEIGPGVSLPPGALLTAYNLNRGGGGADSQGLEEVRKRLPLYLRTQNRAVTRQDYQDTAELAAGVAKAGVEYSCGKFVDVYIAPEGGGVASTALRQSVTAFFADKKAATTRVQVLAAGVVTVRIRAQVTARPNFANSAVADTVRANLIDFLSVARQQIRGAVNIGDVYEVIETSEGVLVSELAVMTTRPYARPVNDGPQLTWERETLPGSQQPVNWRLRFITPTSFQLLRNGSFVNNLMSDTPYTFAEVRFTIAGPGTAGAEYEFYTYPYFGSLQLSEPSIPLAFAEDVELLVSGGL